MARVASGWSGFWDGTTKSYACGPLTCLKLGEQLPRSGMGYPVQQESYRWGLQGCTYCLPYSHCAHKFSLHMLPPPPLLSKYLTILFVNYNSIKLEKGI